MEGVVRLVACQTRVSSSREEKVVWTFAGVVQRRRNASSQTSAGVHLTLQALTQ